MPAEDDEPAQRNLDLPNEAKDEPAKTLPQVVPPKTKAPFTVNQQVNYFHQMPPRAWEKLSAEQITELSKVALEQFGKMDHRHYDLAIREADQQSDSDRRSQRIGGLIAFSGLVALTYLAAIEQTLVAACLAVFLATIIGVVVGKKILD